MELKVSAHQGKVEAGFLSRFKLFLYVLVLHLPSTETVSCSAAVPKGLEVLHLELFHTYTSFTVKVAQIDG